MPSPRCPLLATRLRRYFYSGWAFFIPYLATYLLYSATGWPVNPAGRIQKAVFISVQNPWVPSLLQVYWVFHAIHLTLAAVALRSWWNENSAHCAPKARSAESALCPSYRLHLLTKIIPWAILALIFYIPGVYLEWPSDPWEHLRRINEWHVVDQVTVHSSWKKSSYFLPYSMTGHTTGMAQLSLLNFYSTGGCLLLCWQYFRLAQTTGLSERSSLVFVLLQVLVFGNDTFSFFHYYGLSTTVFAQLGAVAICRIWLTCLQPGAGRLFTHGQPAGLAIATLLLFTVFNHIQAVGIAGLGAAAVLVWRLISWNRPALCWVGAATILINGIFLWVYPRSPLIEFFRETGWLNTIYGFNLYQWPSPAADRAFVILGALGLFNLAAGLLLAWRNHVAGWLTILPVVALSLPIVSVPFASLFKAEPAEILLFHRLLLAIPAGLAGVTWLSQTHKFPPAPAQSPWLSRARTWMSLKIISPVAIVPLSAALLFYAGTLHSGRIWHLLAKSPDDLMLKPAWEVGDDYGRATPPHPPTHVITTCIPGSVIENLQVGHPVNSGRYNRNGATFASDLEGVRRILERPDLAADCGAVLIAPLAIKSVYSQAAVLSRHWSPQEAALAIMGTPELWVLLSNREFTPHPVPQGIVFLPPSSPPP